MFKSYKPKFRWTVEGYSTKYGRFDIGSSGLDIADPHMYKDRFVFYERLNHEVGEGQIYVKDLESGTENFYFGNGAHCSYPFIFSINGSEFICFEQHVRRTTEIFEFKGSDLTLGPCVASVFDGLAVVDVTFFNYDYQLYALYNEDVGDIGDHGGVLKLCRFNTRDFSLDFTATLGTDVRSCRCAGSAKVIGNMLFFTTQKKLPGSYGDGLLLNMLNLRQPIPSHLKTIGLKGFEMSHHIDWRQNSSGFVFDKKLVL